MSDLSIFLNTEIKDSGVLAAMGDFCLGSVRYWCNGSSVEIRLMRGSFEVAGVYHIPSFVERPENFLAQHHLRSSQTRMWKAALAIILFVPGLFFGVILKTFAYFSSDMRERHGFAKRHFTPVVRRIGSPDDRIAGPNALRRAVQEEMGRNAFCQPTEALVIYGRNFEIAQAQDNIMNLRPKKLILAGPRLVFQPQQGVDHGYLANQMQRDLWNVADVMFPPQNLPTVDEALQAPQDDRVQRVFYARAAAV